MADFPLELRHIAGRKNRADPLSRWPNFDDGLKDNEEVTALPDKIFAHIIEATALDQMVEDGQKEHHCYRQDGNPLDSERLYCKSKALRAEWRSILVPLGEVERTRMIRRNCLGLQGSLTGSRDNLIAQGIARDTGDSTCCYRMTK